MATTHVKSYAGCQAGVLSSRKSTVLRLDELFYCSSPVQSSQVKSSRLFPGWFSSPKIRWPDEEAVSIMLIAYSVNQCNHHMSIEPLGMHRIDGNLRNTSTNNVPHSQMYGMKNGSKQALQWHLQHLPP